MKNERKIARGDRELLAHLADGWERSRRQSAEHLVCTAGCRACCHGPFPITRLDAWRLRRGLEALRCSDPRQAAAIDAHARDAREAMREAFPGDPVSGRLETDTDALDRLNQRHRDLPCPVLDPLSGECRLYDARPVACRTYGPPTAFEGKPAAACDLCFTTATEETVERCRWTPDPDGLEQKLLRKLGVEPGNDWECLIAYALTETTEGR